MARTQVEALKHALQTVLEYEDGSDAMLFMHQNDVKTTADFLALDNNNLRTMKLVKANSSGDMEEYFLKQLDIKKLETLRAMYMSIPARTRQSWFRMTPEDYEEFLMGNDPYGGSNVAPSTNNAGATVVPTVSPVAEFNKGIKRSTLDYIKLKENRNWVAYNRHLVSTAASHGISNALDPTYIPITQEDKELFKAQNTFFYSVLVSICLTSDAQKHIRKYEKTLDGQSAYADIMDEYMHGKKADVEADNLRLQIETMRLTDKWNKPLLTYLTQWEHKVLDFETITGKTVSDTQKREWLEATIMGHEALYTAVTNANVVEMAIKELAAKGGNIAADLTFSQFFKIVQNQAVVLDNKYKTKVREQRQGNNSNRNKKQNAKKGEQKKKSAFVPRDQWKKLSDDEKREILEKRKKSSYKANKAENEGQKGDDDVKEDKVKTPPGTMAQRMFSTNHAKSEIMINGVKYQACAANRRYIASQHLSQKYTGSLIDSGANGGISGDDVMVISEDPNKKVDVSGIGNGEIRDAPICTVAGLIETNKGPVIGMFNQYAHSGEGKTIHSVIQMESFGIIVNDRPKELRADGQKIVTPDGFEINLHIRDGLAYMDMKKPSQDDLERFPHVIFTSDVHWDPSIHDNDQTDHVESLEDNSTNDQEYDPDFDIFNCIIDAHKDDSESQVITAMPSIIKKKKPN